MPSALRWVWDSLRPPILLGAASTSRLTGAPHAASHLRLTAWPCAGSRQATANSRQIQPRPTCASRLEADSPMDSGPTIPRHAAATRRHTLYCNYLCAPAWGLDAYLTTSAYCRSGPLCASTICLSLHPQHGLVHAGTAVSASSLPLFSSKFDPAYFLCAPAWSPLHSTACPLTCGHATPP